MEICSVRLTSRPCCRCISTARPRDVLACDHRQDVAKRAFPLDVKRAFPFRVYGRRRPGRTAPRTAVPRGLADTEEVTGSNPVAPTRHNVSLGPPRSAACQQRVVVGRLQQRAWTAEDGSARSVVEVVAEELGQACGGRRRRRPGRRGARSGSQLEQRCDGAGRGWHARIPLRRVRAGETALPPADQGLCDLSAGRGKAKEIICCPERYVPGSVRCAQPPRPGVGPLPSRAAGHGLGAGSGGIGRAIVVWTIPVVAVGRWGESAGSRYAGSPPGRALVIGRTVSITRWATSRSSRLTAGSSDLPA